MKSITEFWSVNLNKGLKVKADLLAGGKTAEEIPTLIGEAFKMEGDKLKHFLNAMEVATNNPEKLARVLVVNLAEGESAPPKSHKVEETTYIPEFQVEARKVVTEKPVRGGGFQKGKGKGGPKESPWGLTPEQKAAKKGGGAAGSPAGNGGAKPS